MASATELLKGMKELFTGFMTVISSDHAYIHKGWAFTGLIKTPSITIPYHIAFKTPATLKEIHWRPLGLTTSANYVGVELREGDASTGGTDNIPINRNRKSILTSLMQSFKQGVIATPVGILIDIDGLGAAGNPASRSGGGSGGDEELLLKSDTDYVLTLTPDGATIVTAKLFWYEEDES